MRVDLPHLSFLRLRSSNTPSALRPLPLWPRAFCLHVTFSREGKTRPVVFLQRKSLQVSFPLSHRIFTGEETSFLSSFRSLFLFGPVVLFLFPLLVTSFSSSSLLGRFLLANLASPHSFLSREERDSSSWETFSLCLKKETFHSLLFLFSHVARQDRPSTSPSSFSSQVFLSLHLRSLLLPSFTFFFFFSPLASVCLLVSSLSVCLSLSCLPRGVHISFFPPLSSLCVKQTSFLFFFSSKSA